MLRLNSLELQHQFVAMRDHLDNDGRVAVTARSDCRSCHAMFRDVGRQIGDRLRIRKTREFALRECDRRRQFPVDRPDRDSEWNGLGEHDQQQLLPEFQIADELQHGGGFCGCGPMAPYGCLNIGATPSSESRGMPDSGRVVHCVT
jgi:hypothetical protein